MGDATGEVEMTGEPVYMVNGDDVVPVGDVTVAMGTRRPDGVRRSDEDSPPPGVLDPPAAALRKKSSVAAACESAAAKLLALERIADALVSMLDLALAVPFASSSIKPKPTSGCGIVGDEVVEGESCEELDTPIGSCRVVSDSLRDRRPRDESDGGPAYCSRRIVSELSAREKQEVMKTVRRRTDGGMAMVALCSRLEASGAGARCARGRLRAQGRCRRAMRRGQHGVPHGIAGLASGTGRTVSTT